jgi:phosphopantetheinyl transferase (holo-ACP synthase)
MKSANVRRWAAKEAIIKASKRKIFMQDIFIYRQVSDGAPLAMILDQGSDGAVSTDINLHSTKVTPDIDTMDGQSVLLSISHEDDYAVATAIVPG